MTIAVLTAAAVGVQATVLVPADLGELTRDAQAITRGTIVAVDGRWTDDRRSIETLVTIESETYLKGQLGTQVQFVVPGGTLGRYRHVVVGAPQFTVGDRVIVFLGVRGPSIPFLVGFSQGVYRLVSQNGDVMVTPPPIVPGVVGPVQRGTEARKLLSLAEFEQSVRTLAVAR